MKDSKIVEIPVMQVVELDWLVVYNMAIAERKFELAEKLIRFFLPR